MEWLSKRSFDMHIGAQLPHAALRVYVMGERGARRDPATPEDNRAMAALAGKRRAIRRAWFLDFAHSQPPHLDRRATTPTLKAGEDELTAIAAAMHGVGRSVLGNSCSDQEHRATKICRWTNRGSPRIPDARSRFPVAQADKAPRRWRQTMDTINEAAARGLSITTQIAGASRRAAAWARIVAQPVPDPSELSRDRQAATGRAG